MEFSFSTNSYYLLGLPVSASQNDIKRKSRLITAKLGIGESSLESDYSFLKAKRTESTIKEAAQRLSSPLKKIQDVYFWFSDDNDSELIKIIKTQSIEEVYTLFRKRAEPTGKWNDKRNFAILLTQLLQYKNEYKLYLEDSVELWKNLINTESAWRFFELYYKNIDDLSTDESVVSDLRVYVDKVISDIYSDLSQKWDDKKYTQQYTKLFNKMGAVTEKKVYEPCAFEIKESCIALDSIEWAKDEPSERNLKTVKEALANIQNSFNILIDNEIYDGSKSIALRDKAAESIRSVGIKFHNDYSDYEKAEGLIEIADKLAGTTALRSQIGEDKTTSQTTKASEEVMLPILELAQKEEWDEAFSLIEKSIKKYAQNKKVLDVLNTSKRVIITRYAIKKHADALATLKNGNQTGCQQSLIDLQKFLLKELDNFNIKREGIESVKKTALDITARINKAQVDVIDNYRSKLVTDTQNVFGESEDATIVIILTDTYLYVPLCDYFKKLHNHYQTANLLINIGFWTLLVYGLGLIPLIIGYYIKGKEVEYVR